MDGDLWRVDTGYACGGVIVQDGHVIEAANIFGWMVGKKWSEVKHWKKIKELIPVGSHHDPAGA